MQKSVCAGAALCLLILLGGHAVCARRVDCTKYVFAPACRGIAAKRGAGSSFVTGNGAEAEAPWYNDYLASNILDEEALPGSGRKQLEEDVTASLEAPSLKGLLGKLGGYGRLEPRERRNQGQKFQHVNLADIFRSLYGGSQNEAEKRDA